jgi:hypothetical protein
MDSDISVKKNEAFLKDQSPDSKNIVKRPLVFQDGVEAHSP